jgi:hypothetical protein
MARTQIGMFIQKTHRQDEYSPIAPPTGTYISDQSAPLITLHKHKNSQLTPILVPKAQAAAFIARYFGRSRRVVISLVITDARERHPPPPRPCTTRAPTSQLIFCAHPQRILPSRKRQIEKIITHFLPLELN